LTSAGDARAEGAQSNANTPKLALHKAEIWLAVAEPKPSVADLDAGLFATSAVEERLTMLNTEIGAVVSRRRTLLGRANACRQRAAELRAERDAARGENGIKRGSADAKIVELEQLAAALVTQAETQHVTMLRLSDEERGLVDAVGRVRGIADLLETSTIADAKQKQKAIVLAAKTTKSIKIHAAIIMTVMHATQDESGE
jgi:hypothetical protein